MESKGGIVLYQARDGKAELQVKLEEDTVWLSLTQMAKLFRKTVPNIGICAAITFTHHSEGINRRYGHRSAN